MCNKVDIKNSGILGFTPECYKDKKLCDKAVDNNYHAFKSCPWML